MVDSHQDKIIKTGSLTELRSRKISKLALYESLFLAMIRWQTSIQVEETVMGEL